MKLITRLCSICMITATIPLAACTTGVSEAHVQAMIDKSITERLGQQKVEPAVAEAEPVGQSSFNSSPTPASDPDPGIDDALNKADMAFRIDAEEGGCLWISNAISWASDRPISADQSRQLKTYASRCNLRY